MSLRWRYDYLRGTEQCVVLIGVTSMFLQVYLRGQCMYLEHSCFISDLADLQLSKGSKLVAYVDDLLLCKPVESKGAEHTSASNSTWLASCWNVCRATNILVS